MTTATKLLNQRAGLVQTAESIEASDNGDAPIIVGLVPSPGLPERIVNDISDDLARELGKSIDSDVRWVIRVIPDPITGSDVETPDLLDELESLADADAWDYTIALTDLPVRRDGKIVIVDASTERRSGWISIPALGAFRLRRKVRRITLQLVKDLYTPSRRDDPDGDHRLESEEVARGEPSESEEMVDITYPSQVMLATPRLLGGMVYANEPWKIFPSFKTTAVTAIGSGSFGIIFASVWELGEHSSVYRLILLTLVAMSLLGAWIIVAHGLWQPHNGAGSRFLTNLYNATTVMTMGTGVVFAYAMIFVVLLLEAAIFMPASLLAHRLEMPVDALNYVTATWVTTNVAMLAGALGAGLEDTDRVRQATFSWRMQHRFEEYEAAREEDESERNER